MLETAVLAAALAPVVVHDSRERFPLTAAEGSRAAAYARSVPAGDGAWLQYWLFYAHQDQDRGVVRTGRHAGDWEMVQFRVDGAGRPLEAVYAQHAGAERCAWSEVRRQDGRPLVFASRGSHASYFRPGVRDRTFPDPNDESDGRGARIRGRVVTVSATSPAFMRRAEPWGGARARWWIPGEQSSPRGPAYQPERWDDPERWARAARSCQAGCDAVDECDGRERAIGAGAMALGLLGAVAGVRRRRARRDP